MIDQRRSKGRSSLTLNVLCSGVEIGLENLVCIEVARLDIMWNDDTGCRLLFIDLPQVNLACQFHFDHQSLVTNLDRIRSKI